MKPRRSAPERNRSRTKRIGIACGIALGNALAFSGCGELIGVGSLSGGGPDASAGADANGGGGMAPMSGERGGAGGEFSGAGGASTGRQLDAGMHSVRDTSLDAQAPAKTTDAGRTTMPLGGASSGGAPVDSGLSPGGCAPGQSERWIPWSGVTPPDDAYVLGGEPIDYNNPDAGYLSTFYVCRARDTAGNVIPGTFVGNSGCYYTPDGMTELQAVHFDVLADFGCLDFPTYSGSVPAHTVTAGNLGKVPLYVCFAVPDDATELVVAGYLEDAPNATCRVPYQGSGYDIATGSIWVLATG
jgi:hypothetical protein